MKTRSYGIVILDPISKATDLFTEEPGIVRMDKKRTTIFGRLWTIALMLSSLGKGRTFGPGIYILNWRRKGIRAVWKIKSVI